MKMKIKIRKTSEVITLKDFEKSATKFYNNFKVRIHSVAPSGMSRKIDIWLNDEIVNDEISKITGINLDKNGRLFVRGCGMDMVFNTLYIVFTGLFPDKRYQEYNFNYKMVWLFFRAHE